MEGKPTLPMIYAMSDPVSGKRIKAIFEQNKISEAEKEEALNLIRRTDAVEKCLSKAKRMIEDAIPKLSCIQDSVYKDSLIGLARYVVGRDR
jgi:octaprenyl-diphosphate synthase